MTLRGHVKNGQITLDDPVTLPEGAELRIEVTERKKETRTEGRDKLAENGEQPTIWQKLLELAGTVEGLPPDMAENHDHYLHGTPKRS